MVTNMDLVTFILIFFVGKPVDNMLHIFNVHFRRLAVSLNLSSGSFLWRNFSLHRNAIKKAESNGAVRRKHSWSNGSQIGFNRTYNNLMRVDTHTHVKKSLHGSRQKVVVVMNGKIIKNVAELEVDCANDYFR